MRMKLQRNINLYYLSEFFAEMLFIIPIFVAFQRQYLTFTQMSLLASARFAVTLILELPTGAFADLFGRKASVLTGLILSAIGLIFTGIGGSAAGIIIGTLIRAIGESFTSGANIALVYDSLKELGEEKRFARVRVTNNLITQIAIVIGILGGGYLYAVFIPLPYILTGLITLLSSIIYSFVQEPKLDSEKFTLSRYLTQTAAGFQELTKTSYNRNLTVFYALVGGISWSWQIYYNLVYVASLGYSEITQGWILSAVRVINAFAISKLITKAIADNQKIMLILFPVFFIISSSAGFNLPPVFNILVLFTMILPSTLRFTLLDRYANEVFESRYRATALSALNMLVGIVYIVFVTATGPLVDRFGVGIVYQISGLSALIFIVPQTIRLIRSRMHSGLKTGNHV